MSNGEETQGPAEGQTTSSSTALIPRGPWDVDPWSASGDAPAAPGGSNIVQTAMQTARRWWKIATPIGVVLGVGIAATLFYLGNRPTYRASAWFRVDTRGEFIVFPTEATSARFVETQVELVRSPLVLSPVVSDPTVGRFLLKQDVRSPLSWLSRNIQVKLVGESEFLEIAFTCEDGVIAKQVVERVSESYLAAYTEEATTQRKQVIELLEAEKASVMEKVNRCREAVRVQSKLSLGSDPFRIDGDDAIQAQAAARRAATALEMDRRLLEAELDIELADDELIAFAKAAAPGYADAIADLAAGTPGDAAEENEGATQEGAVAAETHSVDVPKLRRLLETALLGEARQSAQKVIVTTPEVDELRERIESATEELAQMRDKEASRAMLFVPSSPNGRRRVQSAEDALAKQIADDRETLEEWEARVQAAELAKLTPGVEDVLAEFDRKVAEMARLRRMHELLTERRSDLDGSNSGDSGQFITMDLEFARSELQRVEEVHQRIADRLLAMRTEERAPPRVTESTTEPYVVNTFSAEALYRKVGAGGLVGLMLPFGLALLWDLAQGRVGGSGHAKESLNLPVLGEVGSLPKTSPLMLSYSVKGFSHRQMVFEESIANLASQISYSNSLAGAQVLVITSAVSGEGKSTLASRLGAALAQLHQESVLVVDADLRNPNVGKMLNVSSAHGLADVLRGDLQLDDAVKATAFEHLYALTCDASPNPPRHLLGNGELRALLASMRARFRYVVIDTAPVLSSAETLPIAKAGDATFVCTLRDVSRVSQVRLAVEKLTMVGCKVAGTILSGVSAGSYRGAYGGSSRPQFAESTASV